MHTASCSRVPGCARSRCAARPDMRRRRGRRDGPRPAAAGRVDWGHPPPGPVVAVAVARVLARRCTGRDSAPRLAPPSWLAIARSWVRASLWPTRHQASVACRADQPAGGASGRRHCRHHRRAARLAITVPGVDKRHREPAGQIRCWLVPEHRPSGLRLERAHSAATATPSRSSPRFRSRCESRATS